MGLTPKRTTASHCFSVQLMSNELFTFLFCAATFLSTTVDGQQQQNVTTATLFGFRIDGEDAVSAYEPKGQLAVSPDHKATFIGFGQNLNLVKSVTFTKSKTDCLSQAFNATTFSEYSKTRLSFAIELTEEDEKPFYICLCDFDGSGNVTGSCINQGDNGFVTLLSRVKQKRYYLPVPLQIVIIVCLLVLSGLFSGLNLGLMSLDKTELKIILKVGDDKEREYAKKIYPVRKSGNYLLCTLLLGNVVVNSGISILFDDLTTGYIALVFASLGIVVFGEIVPQAICSRYGLAVGAYTILITRFFMILTFPLSWPISKLLDKALGEEVGQVYNRERLLELIRMSKDQEGDLQNCQEVQIVYGALELSKKTVGDVMTPVSGIFMLPSDVILDPKSVSEIVKSGFTRIPVHEPGNRNNVVYMLNVKDLALLDPEDKIPLTTICQFYQHPVRFVLEDTPLGVMLEEFKKGHYHIAIVQRINAEGDGDPVYEAVGLITLEDIIEEIIQSEIRDEFDVIRDSRRNKQRMKRRGTGVAMQGGLGLGPDVTIFFDKSIDSSDVSPQLTLATYQYLSTTLEAFGRQFISESVLHRLIRQNVMRTKASDLDDPSASQLYQKGREADYFVLILEGKCSVTVGEADMLFEAGPFHYFGYELLTKITRDIYRRGSVVSMTGVNRNGSVVTATAAAASPQVDVVVDGAASTPRKYSFVPDFTLILGQQDLVYLKVKSSVYSKAYRASLIERGRGSVAAGLGSGCVGGNLRDARMTTSGSESMLNSPEAGVVSAAIRNVSTTPSGRHSTVSSERARSLSEERKTLLPAAQHSADPTVGVISEDVIKEE